MKSVDFRLDLMPELAHVLHDSDFQMKLQIQEST